jgi:hypothetical protein
VRALPRIVAIAAALTVVVASAPLGGATQPDLTGTWVLNKDRSDTVEDRDRGKPKPGILGSGPGMGGNGPMGGAGVSGPLMGGRGVDPVLAERMRALASLAFDMPDELTVTSENDGLRFVGDDGHATRLTPDGSKRNEIDRTLPVERRTKWDKDRLVTEVKAKGGGGEVKHVYTRQGDRLLVEATFDGEVAARTEKLKFVYDRKE